MPPQPMLNPSRFKTSLKVAISKLQFIQDKKTALTKQQRRQLADLLNQGKETSAKIRVENIIRDDIYIELLEFLELYCELLLARIALISDPTRTTCDPSLIESVHSVIYSAPHTELKELSVIKEWFIHKFGIEFSKAASENRDNSVPEKIVKRCQVEPPSEMLVNLYLSEIARAYGAPYSGLKDLPEEEDNKEKGQNDDNSDDDEPSGGEAIKNKTEPIAVGEEAAPAASKPMDDFDALKARFAALKK